MTQNYFFVGAGGIGMTNLERYFLAKCCRVGGYDRVKTLLTTQLEKEGAALIYEDNPELIPECFLDPASTTVVYTPAIPADNRILSLFRERGFNLIKRAAVLGQITRAERGICVAGSHGKTTTSSMIAWILSKTKEGCNAFLGGILRNTDSNLMLSLDSDLAVIEADEYDRSFHQLSPWLAVITSTDPDHLDIYGDEEHYLEAFSIFTSLIQPGGYLLLHTGLAMTPMTSPGVTVMTYSGPDTSKPRGDWYPTDIRFDSGHLYFTLCGPEEVRVEGIDLGVPVEINIDNAVAAGAAAMIAGASPEAVKEGLSSFLGAKRRFEFWIRPESPHQTVLLDDYAHSPAEIEASIRSVRKLYPEKKISVIFQPHLYTRTRDFAPGFAQALSHSDEVILTEIYPARELPIPGVDSHLIGNQLTTKWQFCERKDLLELIKNRNFEILMTLGAADLDVLLPEIKCILSQNVENAC